jgi:hypothetical protein
MVASSGGHLERPPCVVLTPDVSKVEQVHLLAWPHRESNRVSGKRAGHIIPVCCCDVRQSRNPNNLGTGNEPRLLKVCDGDNNPSGAARDGGRDGGQYAPYRSDAAIEPELT